MLVGGDLGCGLDHVMKPRRVFIGTSGWTYDDWYGSFYPEDMKGSERLSFYAEQFNTVEVNATFYRLPTEPMIKAWNARLGKDFHLVVKGSRVVTHLKKIADCKESLEKFFDRAFKLTRLEVILWQLPPSLHKDVERLETFLSSLPKECRHAVEFRHESWWADEVARILSDHDCAFVAISHPSLPETILPTTDFLYVRFHGQDRDAYRYDYSDKELAHWVSILKRRLHGRTLYAFFNNDYNANAPRNALTLKELFSQ
jgi:uncharacterized protein YecE (DUF72 family)